MITVVLNETEILQIAKIRVRYQQSVFAIIYVTFISILSLALYQDFLIVPIIILFGGYVIAGMFYYFAKQTILIKIGTEVINVNGTLITSRNRKFKLERYTKIVLREYIGSRLDVDWDCDLHVDRKYITIFSGDKRTGELIAMNISENLNIPLEIIPSRKIRKKQVYAWSSRIFSTTLVIIPLMILFFLIKINLIVIFILLLVWLVLISASTLMSAYYVSK
ncbi:MAG: hypothetical protein ACC656_10260 [Candidatus Heimdallarchaeota archaeon]